MRRVFFFILQITIAFGHGELGEQITTPDPHGGGVSVAYNRIAPRD